MKIADYRRLWEEFRGAIHSFSNSENAQIFRRYWKNGLSHIGDLTFRLHDFLDQSLVLCRQKWSFLIKIGHLLGVFCSQLSPVCWNPKLSNTRIIKSHWMGNLLTYLSTQLVFSCKWINIIGFYEWPFHERNQQAHHVNENSIAEKAIFVNYADK